MTVLRFGLTPKMKPVSPRRAAVVAALDIGTSKVVCMIARLEPQAPQDVLRRRSHGVRILGFAHTAARRGDTGFILGVRPKRSTVMRRLRHRRRAGSNRPVRGADLRILRGGLGDPSLPVLQTLSPLRGVRHRRL